MKPLKTFLLLSLLGVLPVLFFSGPYLHRISHEGLDDSDAFGYAYVSDRLLQGDVLYKDIWDTKPPGIFILNGMVFKCFGRHLRFLSGFAFFYEFFTALFFSVFAFRLFGGYPPAFLAGGLLIALRFHMTPPANLSETYLLMPVLLSLLFSLPLIKSPPLLRVGDLLAGVLAGVALMIRPTGLLECLPPYFRPFKSDRLMKFSMGFSVVFLTVCLYFWHQGCLYEFFHGSFLFHLRTLRHVPPFSKKFPHWSPKVDGSWLLFFIALASLSAWLCRKFSLNRSDFLFAIHAWIIMAFVSVFMKGFQSYHYFVILYAPIVLSSLIPAYFLYERRKKVLSLGVLLLTSGIIVLSTGPTSASLTTGLRDWGGVEEFLHSSVPPSEPDITGQILARLPEDIQGKFVFTSLMDDGRQFLARSSALSVTRFYFVDTFIRLFNRPRYHSEILNDFVKKKPEFLFLCEAPEPKIEGFPELDGYLKENYTHISKIENTDVFRLKNN